MKKKKLYADATSQPLFSKKKTQDIRETEEILTDKLII
jgi:hypothetical protein